MALALVAVIDLFRIYFTRVLLNNFLKIILVVFHLLIIFRKKALHKIVLSQNNEQKSSSNLYFKWQLVKHVSLRYKVEQVAGKQKNLTHSVGPLPGSMHHHKIWLIHEAPLHELTGVTWLAHLLFLIILEVFSELLDLFFFTPSGLGIF